LAAILSIVKIISVPFNFRSYFSIKFWPLKFLPRLGNLYDMVFSEDMDLRGIGFEKPYDYEKFSEPLGNRENLVHSIREEFMILKELLKTLFPEIFTVKNYS
jgi:hypothetical protein